METEAKLFIQESIKNGAIELTWSFVLDYENGQNPYPLKQRSISSWKELAVIDVGETEELLVLAERFAGYGLDSKDSLHIACAAISHCDYFITTDKGIIRKRSLITEVKIINPMEYWNRAEDIHHEK